MVEITRLGLQARATAGGWESFERKARYLKLRGLSFSFFLFSRNIRERNPLGNQSPAIRDYKIFQAFPIIFLIFVSLNTFKSTFEKLLISGYQTRVGFTNPPTSLCWVVASKATVNVYQCEPDPETARKGAKFSLVYEETVGCW